MKIKKINKEFECFITVKDFKENKKGYFSVKDNICTKGVKTTAGSKILENYVPVFDATCVEKAKKAGIELIGKTSMDEFAFGAYGTHCAYNLPKNPWDKKRVAGGSSSGAAVITAVADFKNHTIAESTGGSISCPASFCGVAGITPTYGTVSRYGLIDFGNSLDKIGTMGKTVEEAAEFLKIISGKDKRDQTSIENKIKGVKDFKKIKIGIPKQYVNENVDKGVLKAFYSAVDKLDFVQIQKISLKASDFSIPVYYVLGCSEASTNLAKFCGLRYGIEKENIEDYDFNEYFSEIRAQGFGEEVKRRIILGSFVRMAGYRGRYYKKALIGRQKIINDFKKGLKKVDVIVAPTMPIYCTKIQGCC